MQIQAECVFGGYQAVSCVEQAHRLGKDFDVCFLDFRMPDMDGLEAAQRIHKITGSILSVILTAYNAAGIEQTASEAGAAGIAIKPLFESAITETLVRLRQETPLYTMRR